MKNVKLQNNGHGSGTESTSDKRILGMMVTVSEPWHFNRTLLVWFNIMHSKACAVPRFSSMLLIQNQSNIELLTIPTTPIMAIYKLIFCYTA